MAEFFVLQSKPKIMDKIIITIIFLIGALLYIIPDSTEPKVEPRPKVDMSGSQGEFIKKYANVAVKESKAFKIPCSVILAVATVNSECYDHPEHHNLFHLPPDTDWEGSVVTYAEQGGGEYTLKKYDTAWGSFRDFSITVSDLTIAQGVGTEGLTVDGWLYILQEAGLCDAVAVKTVIDKYRLTVLDNVK